MNSEIPGSSVLRSDSTNSGFYAGRSPRNYVLAGLCLLLALGIAKFDASIGYASGGSVLEAISVAGCGPTNPCTLASLLPLLGSSDLLYIYSGTYNVTSLSITSSIRGFQGRPTLRLSDGSSSSFTGVDLAQVNIASGGLSTTIQLSGGTFQDVTLQGLTISSSPGTANFTAVLFDGVYFSGSGSALLTGCRAINSNANVFWGSSASIHAESTEFADSTQAYIFTVATASTFVNCTFARINGVYHIFEWANAPLTFLGCTFVDNTCSQGLVASHSNIVVDNCLFQDNNAPLVTGYPQAGATYVLTISNTVMRNNNCLKADYRCIFTYQAEPLVIFNVTMDQNTGPLRSWTAPISLIVSHFFDNTPVELSSSISLDSTHFVRGSRYGAWAFQTAPQSTGCLELGIDAASEVSGYTQVYYGCDSSWVWIPVPGTNGTVNTPGVPGVLGQEAPDNSPPSAADASSTTSTDAAGNTLFWVYGGYYSSTWSDKLFRYNASSRRWTLMADGSSTLGYRNNMLLTWNNVTNSLWLFGGSTQAVYMSDMWEWTQGGGFVRRHNGSSAPSGRRNPAGFFDWQDKIYIFGGYNGTSLADTWVFQISTLSWAYLTGPLTADFQGEFNGLDLPGSPGGRYHAAFARSPYGTLYIYGGLQLCCTALWGDVWEFFPQNVTWVARYTTTASVAIYTGIPTPGPRFATSVGVSHDGLLTIFGGCKTHAYVYGDEWQMDPRNGGNWTLVNNGSSNLLSYVPSLSYPGVRFYSQSFVDSNDYLCVFGGFSTSISNAYNDLFCTRPPSRPVEPPVAPPSTGLCNGTSECPGGVCVLGHCATQRSNSSGLVLVGDVQVTNSSAAVLVSVTITGDLQVPPQTTLSLGLTAQVSVQGCAVLDPDSHLLINLADVPVDRLNSSEPFVALTYNCLQGTFSTVDTTAMIDPCSSATASPTYSNTSLSVLFQIVPTGVCSSPEALDTIGLAVGVTVGGVLLIVGVILLAVFVPAFRKKAQPFRDRGTDNSLELDVTKST